MFARTASALTALIALAALGQSPGCSALVTDVVRASSFDHMTIDAAGRSFAMTTGELRAGLHEAFAARGFPLADKHVSGDSVCYVYRGPRETVTTVKDGLGGLTSESYGVGSVFYAVVEPAHSGGTDLSVLGKPTVGGADLCSDADILLTRFEYWCEDSRSKAGWPGNAMITGREEADTVRGLLIELEERLPAGTVDD